MLVGLDAVTIFGVVFGFGLWLGLVLAVHRWGPFEDDQSVRAMLDRVTARLHEADPDGKE